MRADLTIDGPGVVLHVHGDGPVLIADVHAELKLKSAARALRSVPRMIRYVRSVSRSLRTTGLRLEIRFGGRTFVRLG